MRAFECPHPGLKVGSRCYWCCKTAALNGGRARLSDEQLGFVGVDRDVSVEPRSWAPAGANALLEQQQQELAELLDTMPGWVRLAREIVKDE